MSRKDLLAAIAGVDVTVIGIHDMDGVGGLVGLISPVDNLMKSQNGANIKKKAVSRWNKHQCLEDS